jgi:hypothetical protein
MQTDPTESMTSAALRHLRDAEHLLEPGVAESVDQAWHLVGLAVECMEKACLGDQRLHRAIGHLGEVDAESMCFVLSLDPRAAQLGVTGVPPSPLRAWSINCRYDTTGERERPEVEHALAAAAPYVAMLAAARWADGRLSGAWA